MNGAFMKSSMDFNKSVVKRQQRSLSHTKPRDIIRRNQDLSSTCNTFKETTQCSPDKSAYLQNYQMHNSNGNYDTFYSIKKEKERYAQNVVPQYQKPKGSKNEINHYAPVHYNNMHLVRNKQYVNERINVDMATGQIHKKSEYLQNKDNSNQQQQFESKRSRAYSTATQEKSNSIGLARQNLYMSNCDKDIKVNQDLIKNRNIRHVSAASDGSPEWFKTSMNYYSKPFLQGKVYTYQGPQFQVIPSNQKSIYQDIKIKNPSGLFNECTRRERKDIKEIKKDTYKMNWDVSDNEKTFRVTQKVGTSSNWTQNDTIKNIVFRRQQTDMVADKIGNSPLNSSINQQRPILLKIGHESYVNTQRIA